MNGCCLQWKSLSETVQGYLNKDIEGYKKKGVPDTFLATSEHVAENLKNFCPVCGKGLVSTFKPREVLAESSTEVVKPAPAPKRAKCGECKGTGKIPELGVTCGSCLGNGLEQLA